MNWEFFNIIATILGVTLTIATIIGSIIYVKTKVKEAKENGGDAITAKAISELNITVSALQAQNGLQADAIKESKETIISQGGQIKELNGKVDTLSTIPLAKIEQHMNDTNKILTLLLPLLPLTSTEHTVTESTTTKN